MNKMKEIRVDKVTLNFGAGKDQKHLENGIALIKMIAGEDPVKTYSDQRIPAWGLRPGLPIGAKLTLRGEQAEKIIQRFLVAKDKKLNVSCVDDYGNVSFGIPEYIDIPDVKYDPKVGVMGLQISITLARPGFRVAKRKLKQQRVGRTHQIRKEEAQEFMKKTFGVEFIQ
jgi:large subunit ribosomal protein L5